MGKNFFNGSKLKNEVLLKNKSPRLYEKMNYYNYE